MNITQTSYFLDDLKHYTKLINDYKYSSNRDDIRRSLYRLEKLRGREYCDKLAAKANQKAKYKFYYREATET